MAMERLEFFKKNVVVELEKRRQLACREILACSPPTPSPTMSVFFISLLS
jgi:hypothetical protein